MLDRALLDEYEDEILKAVKLRHVCIENRAALDVGSDSIIFGTLIQEYVARALRVVASEEQEGALAQVERDEMAQGLTFLSYAAIMSEARYDLTHPSVLNRADFREEISQLHGNAVNGIIQLVPEAFAMTREEGRSQVEYADVAFSLLKPRIQRWLSQLNYSRFNAKTMLTGRALLSSEERLDLMTWTEDKRQAAMPHLALSNIAMGEVMSHLLRRLRPDEPLTVIDTGSGTGCTLAGVLLGIEDALEKGAEFQNLSLTGIEGSPDFFNQELVPFAGVAGERILGLCLTKNIFNGPAAHELNQGQFNLIYGDILDTLQQLTLSPDVQNGVMIITANYVWHRLPTNIKQALIQEVTRKAPNAIFMVADLVENASVVNRRYFNFRDNGLLNCGNRGLKELFEKNGYRVRPLNAETAPASMNAQLAQRIGEGVTSDSIFYIAYKGPRAAELVERG